MSNIAPANLCCPATRFFRWHRKIMAFKNEIILLIVNLYPNQFYLTLKKVQQKMNSI